MNLTDIFKDSLNYPIKDMKLLIILGVILSVASIINYASGNAGGLGFICSILSILISFIVIGYYLSVIKDSIDLSDKIPSFDPKNNLVDGLKAFVVSLVYGIIYILIAFIIALITGAFSGIFKISSAIMNSAAVNTTGVSSASFQAALSDPAVAQVISHNVMGISLALVLIAIISIIFVLVVPIAFCRLAKYDSIGSALNFVDVFGDISSIGFLRYLGWAIIFILIMLVISIILGILFGVAALLGPIGIIIITIIFSLIVSPYVFMFEARALGLLYSEI